MSLAMNRGKKAIEVILTVVLVMALTGNALANGVSHRSDATKVSLFLHPISQDKCVISKVLPQVSKAYENLMDQSFYDASIYYIDWNGNPLKKPIRKSSEISFDSLKLFKKYGSASEFGFLSFLKEQIQSVANLQIIPAVLPERYRTQGAPNYDHTAGLIWCRDGYILLDPGMNLTKPVVLKDGVPSYANSDGGEKWQIVLDSKKDQITVTMNSSDPSKNPWTKQKQAQNAFRYTLAIATNVDQVITVPLFLHSSVILIFKFSRPDQPFYAMAIDLEKKQVRLTRLDVNGKREHFLILNFDDYFKNPSLFEKQFNSHPEVNHIPIKKDVLFSRVKSILDNIKD